MSKTLLILRTIALQGFAVLLGVVWWWVATYWGSGIANWLPVGLLAVILLGVASYRARARESNLSRVCAGLAGYALIVMLVDPYIWWIGHKPGDVSFIGFILPPLLLLNYLVRSRAWLAVCGVILFSAASIACLLFNATAQGWGIGFSGWWVS